MRPLVSIIVPSFNQGRFIRETIESILDQDYRPLELLVMDGASKDETVEVLQSFDRRPELRWVSEPDSGVVEAVNKGFKLARGSVGAIQSSDDAYLPGAVAAAMALLEREPDLAFVLGDIIKVDEGGREIDRTRLPPYSLPGMLSMQTWVPQPSTFFNMELAKQLGGWREGVSFAADTDMWLRMALRGRAKKVDQVWAKRRMHGEQRDRQGARIIRDYDRMIEQFLQEAPPELRGPALAGRMMLRNRYDPGRGYWIRLGRLWRAVCAYPALRKSIPPGSLIPGWYAARAMARTLVKGDAGGGPARFSLKQKLGVLLLDLPRWLPHLSRHGRWPRVRNRQDQLHLDAGGWGVKCEGRWSSPMHAARVFPALGRKLMRRALSQYPIVLAEKDLSPPDPEISVIIPFWGRDRLPLLGAVLRSVCGQSGRRVQCVVVEQGPERTLESGPFGSKHLFIEESGNPPAWRKSHAMNRAAAASDAPLLVFHDADILMPAAYADEVWRRLETDGFESAHLQRFLFCLSREQTAHYLRNAEHGLRGCEEVRQNWQGGTVAIRREAFLALGGFDEAFVDWGGEDNEFYDRCSLLRRTELGYLPFVHLWHAAQPGKSGENRERNIRMLMQRLKEPAAERQKELLLRQRMKA